MSQNTDPKNTSFVSPSGDRIVGTSETVLATAWIAGIDPETHEPIYEGGTEIHWDTQVTLERDGEILFVCETGKAWTFDQLSAVAQEPDAKLGI